MNVYDTRGILSKPAGVTLAVLLGVAALVSTGWRARHAFEAEAAAIAGSEKLERKLDGIDQRQREIAVDVAVIKTKVETLEKRGR